MLSSVTISGLQNTVVSCYALKLLKEEFSATSSKRQGKIQYLNSKMKMTGKNVALQEFNL